MIFYSEVNFGTDIHGGQEMNPNDFGHSLSFALGPPPGQYFALSSGISPNVLDGLSKERSADFHGFGWMDCHEKDIHVPLRINYNIFGDRFTFHLALSYI